MRAKALDSFPVVNWFMSPDPPLTTADHPSCIVFWVTAGLCLSVWCGLFTLGCTSEDRFFFSWSQSKKPEPLLFAVLIKVAAYV